jgi:hypothetical protein
VHGLIVGASSIKPAQEEEEAEERLHSSNERRTKANCELTAWQCNDNGGGMREREKEREKGEGRRRKWQRIRLNKKGPEVETNVAKSDKKINCSAEQAVD